MCGFYMCLFLLSGFIAVGGKVLGKVLDQVVYNCTPSMFTKLQSSVHDVGRKAMILTSESSLLICSWPTGSRFHP